MRKFLGQDAATQRLALEQTAALKAMDQMAVEKDFWVCWTLGQLFALPEIGGCLTFKGGTSLSKVWGLIQRFSEDIDLVIDKGWLGITEENDPEAAASPSQLKKRLKIVEEMTVVRIAGTFLPALQDAIRRALPDKTWSLGHDPLDPQVLLFRYPRLIVGEASYFDPVVKIELGTRSDPIPTQIRMVQAEVALAFPQAFDQPQVRLRALEPARTFLEKVSLLHETGFKSAQGKARPAKLARHYYDVAKLIEAGIGRQVMEDAALFERVIANRRVYFKVTGLDYDAMLWDGLKIVPEEPFKEMWARDYADMRREMFYGTPPAWSVVIQSVAAWEIEFNQRRAMRIAARAKGDPGPGCA